MQRLALAPLLVFWPGVLLLAVGPPVAPDGDQALSRRILASAAAVRAGDVVQLQGAPRDLPLLEELAVQARRRGAHPLITCTSDRLARRYFDEVPPAFDDQPPRAELALARAIDVLVSVESRDDDTFAGVPPARQVAANRASEGVAAALLARNVRTVFVGNRLYPTPGRARQYGLTVAELDRLFRAGLSADPARLQARGASVRKALEAGKQLRIVGPGGTDLTCRIAGRPVVVSDGVLTPQREKKAGAAIITWLPAGEVAVTPVPGTAAGTVAAGRFDWQGQPVRGLRMTLADGKVTSLRAESGEGPLLAAYARQRAGKESLGVIDLGINDSLRADSGVATYIPAGMVTVGVGGNTWAGGDNDINFALECHLPGCTVWVDGRPIIERGDLKP